MTHTESLRALALLLPEHAPQLLAAATALDTLDALAAQTVRQRMEIAELNARIAELAAGSFWP